MLAQLQPVLANYAVSEAGIVAEPLSAGGFSGAMLWRIHGSKQPLCLRRWPPRHPSRGRLQFIHRVLQHLGRCGFGIVPVPLWTRDGQTLVSHGGHLWELTPWLPGRPESMLEQQPQKLAAAMTRLAEFHVVAASYRPPDQHSWDACGVSPGLQERVGHIDRLRRGESALLLRSVRRVDPHHPLHASAIRFLQLFDEVVGVVERRARNGMTLRVSLQPCLRDIWYEHVLFLDREVSGIVDFGALRTETVAGDIARLLSSVTAAGTEAWHHGLAAYQRARQLSSNELTLVDLLNSSGTLLSGINWIRWVFVEGRGFSDPSAVSRRFSATLSRLEHLRQCLDG